jgi:maltooligosyltrehalose trehalohydrolase
MEALGEGWFRSDPLASATDYAFSLDGSEPLPDPRSSSQPNGVHGPSRVVDHDAFTWSDSAWSAPPLSDSILYELHVGTFTPEGTFDAAVEKLDHISRLGATAIELMPVVHFPGARNWGYDGVDLFAPHEIYGGSEGLKRLVDAAHARRLAVVLDVVCNHLGPDGNYLRRFGPYLSERYSTPWGQAINFDGAGSDEVRAFFVDNCLYWLERYRIDGLRLDAVHAIFDTSAVHILEEIGDRVRDLAARLGRNLWVIAESDLNDPRLVGDKSAGGYGLDAQWSDDFHHSIHSLLAGERTGYYADFGTVGHLAKALRQAFVYDGTYSRYRRRRHGRPPVGIPASRFLGHIQTHDQVGNRALGERIGHLVSSELLKTASALVYTSPFVPMLFMGEEWNAGSPFHYFTDHDNPHLGRAVAEGRRREFAAFGWDPDVVLNPQDPAAYEASKLRWNELDEQPHADMFEWYRGLIALRREHLSGGGAVVTRYDDEKRWLTFERGPITVACNFSGVPASIPVGPISELLLGSGKPPSVNHDEATLEPESVAIWSSSPRG